MSQVEQLESPKQQSSSNTMYKKNDIPSWSKLIAGFDKTIAYKATIGLVIIIS